MLSLTLLSLLRGSWVSLFPVVWYGAIRSVPIEEFADPYLACSSLTSRILGAALGGRRSSTDRHCLVCCCVRWARSGQGRRGSPVAGTRRFTLAHELGHWRSHKDADEGAVFCWSGSIAPDVQTREQLPPTGDEANLFAAAVLVPAWLVRSSASGASETSSGYGTRSPRRARRCDGGSRRRRCWRCLS